MRRLRLTCAALLGCALMAFAPASALAVSRAVSDCQKHNGLHGHYSDRQLQQALKTMPPTTAEYSNCEQIIQDQLNRQLSGRGKGADADADAGKIDSGGGSSSALPIVVVVVVVLIVAGGGFLYWRRRSGGGDSEAPPPPAT